MRVGRRVSQQRRPDNGRSRSEEQCHGAASEVEQAVRVEAPLALQVSVSVTTATTRPGTGGWDVSASIRRRTARALRARWNRPDRVHGTPKPIRAHGQFQSIVVTTTSPAWIRKSAKFGRHG